MIAEKAAGILERVKRVKDEAILDAVTDILDAYLRAQKLADTFQKESDSPVFFDPLEHHSEAEILGFEQKDDFLGYAIDGTPLFGTEEAAKADLAIENILNGTEKGITLDELKAKLNKKMEGWRQRTA